MAWRGHRTRTASRKASGEWEPASLFDRAVEAIQHGDFRAGREALNMLVEDQPRNAEAWLQLGVCYLELRQPAPAIEAFARSLTLDPTSALGHSYLGTAHAATGELERASACYRRALEIEPELERAEEYLIRTESLLASRTHYLAGLRLLYSTKPSAADLNQALRELIESATFFKDSPARQNLRECARRLLALKRFWTPPCLGTREAAGWAAACRRGLECLGREDWRAARAAYLEALKHGEDQAFIHHALGFCRIELGEIDSAIRDWHRTLELDPGYDFRRFGRPQAK
jgi:tetratricopeptide (TPR) repeat protein